MRQASMLPSSVRSGPRAFSASRRSVVPMAKFSTANVMDLYNKDQMKPDYRPVKVGDTVRLGLAVVEAKGKTRTQSLEGLIIGEQSFGANKTVTFRRVFQGVGIELKLPVHAPVVQSLEFIKSGKIRRAKLNYLRKRVGKSARLLEKVVETATRRAEIKADDAAKAASAAAAAAPGILAAAAAAAATAAEVKKATALAKKEKEAARKAKWAASKATTA